MLFLMEPTEGLPPIQPEIVQATDAERRRQVEALITDAPHGLVGLVYEESMQRDPDRRAETFEDFRNQGFSPGGDTLQVAGQILREAPVHQINGEDRVIDLGKLTHASYVALIDEQNGPQADVVFGRGLQLNMTGLVGKQRFERESPDGDLLLLHRYRADALLTALYAAGVDSVATRRQGAIRPRMHEIRYPHVDPRTGAITVSIINMDTHYASALAACLENKVVANRGRL